MAGRLDVRQVRAQPVAGEDLAAAGWGAARLTEARPDNLSGRERTLPQAKDGLMGVAVLTGVASGAQGARLAKQAPDGAVPVRTSTTPAPDTPPKAATIQRTLGVLGLDRRPGGRPADDHQGRVVLLALVVLALVLAGPIASAVGSAIGVAGTAVTVWNIAKWPVLFLVVVLMIALLHCASPNAKLGGLKSIVPGAPPAWITNVAILLGAELNAERERTRELKEGAPEAERELQLEERSQPKAGKRSRTAYPRRASPSARPPSERNTVEIPKDKVLDMIRQQGKGDQAGQAEKELPDQVDPERDAGMLEKFGVKPQDVMSKLGGGGIPGL